MLFSSMQGKSMSFPIIFLFFYAQEGSRPVSLPLPFPLIHVQISDMN
jgi:hypothetical protein